MNYHGKQALVLGLGESGLAMARWLARCGAAVRVADTRHAPARLPALAEHVPSARFIAGSGAALFDAGLIEGVDFIAVSPGLAPARELAAILPAAAAAGIAVWGEIELFAQALAGLRGADVDTEAAAAAAADIPAEAGTTPGSAAQATAHVPAGYRPKVIAITGTNGKTTVTSLVGLLCRRAGLSVQVAGNISPAALDVLRDALDNDSLPQAWVLELSSFQLQTCFSLQADAATVLNISQDHLDWHGDMASYAQAKSRIFGLRTVRVLNRDDELSAAMGRSAAGDAVTTFGADEPDSAGDFGLVRDNGMQWLAVAVAGEAGEKKRRRETVETPVTINRLMPADALKIRGQHNAVNALAALALCRAVGLPLAPLLHGLRDYRGEPHRVELVATVAGVAYYDDSKGTNVGATVAAVNGLGAEFSGGSGRLLLIAGGEGKGQDFAPLAVPVARHARAVLLIGRDKALIRAALRDGAPGSANAGGAAGAPLIDCDSLEEALEQAARLAISGDAVLLSPACASFDMFRDYVHRAEVFVDAVRELALSRGEVLA